MEYKKALLTGIRGERLWLLRQPRDLPGRTVRKQKQPYMARCAAQDYENTSGGFASPLRDKLHFAIRR